MSVEIKGMVLKPLRHTYDHVARHLGSDQPASRYLEATIDVQAQVNFHYRPLWDPDREIFDAQRTGIVMSNWNAFLDPRQFYYGTWTMARAKQQDGAERHLDFVEKRGLIDLLPPGCRSNIIRFVLPLRHVEYGANLNNCYITAYGYAAALTQASMMCAEDRLGIAQHITKIGLLLDGNSGDSLREAKAIWSNDPLWQPMRALLERTLVTKDWFELFVAQNFVIDGLMYPLVYQHFERAWAAAGGPAFAMLTEFMTQWYEDHVRWVDQMLSVAAAQSPANATLLAQWFMHWRTSVSRAIEPVAHQALGTGGAEIFTAMGSSLTARAAKAGLQIGS